MNYQQLFEKWNLTKIKIRTKFLEVEIEPNKEDREAAWEMYVELITRIITQKLNSEDGDEQTALASIHSLFESTRIILKEKGRRATAFSRIAVIILNQIIRPFTAKWHKCALDGAFNDPEQCQCFRAELNELQGDMRSYAGILAELAAVEDITDINDI